VQESLRGPDLHTNEHGDRKDFFQGGSSGFFQTCESTQPTLNTTVLYGTFVLEFGQSFAETIARNDPWWSELQKVKLHSQEHWVIPWHI